MSFAQCVLDDILKEAKKYNAKKVKTDDGVTVLVPNSNLLKSPIHNYGVKK